MERSSLNNPARRYAIGIEYDGSAYSGWQSQPHAPSVQEALNKALSTVADEPVMCTGAGRTDAGVHATAQVAHFDSPVPRTPDSWLLGANSNLPKDISVLWTQSVSEAFHARFSALARHYRYVILNRRVRSALHRDRAWWVYRPLDHEKMQEAARCLLGCHDFSSFRASSCQSHSPVRTVSLLDVWRDGEFIYVDCHADAFLHHMVRNIVGSLVRVGLGDEEIRWVATTLKARDRKLSGMTAPAGGLSLTGVVYPAELLPGQSL